MSVSIHLNGKPASQMRPAIFKHVVRQTEGEGEEVAKNTDSAIDPALTPYNVLLMTPDSGRFGAMRKKAEAISEARKAAGKKALYKNTNLFMTGTLQLSDDTLALMGWKSDENGKKLPVDKQSEKAVKLVTAVYASVFKSVKEQPDLYGDVFAASLHFDEGAPHVDFLVDPLDTEHPERTASYYLNGAPGTPKGAQLSKMQDCLLDKCPLQDNVRQAFDIRRGDSEAKRVDLARQTRKAKKQAENAKNDVKEANARKKALQAEIRGLEAKAGDLSIQAQKALETANTQAQAILQDAERKAKEREAAVACREKAVTKREMAVKAVSLQNSKEKRELKARAVLLDAKEAKLAEITQNNQETEHRIDVKLAKTEEMVNKLDRAAVGLRQIRERLRKDLVEPQKSRVQRKAIEVLDSHPLEKPEDGIALANAIEQLMDEEGLSL